MQSGLFGCNEASFRCQAVVSWKAFGPWVRSEVAIQGCSLESANLTDAMLGAGYAVQGANLTDADLTGANLTDALIGADLATGNPADLADADMEGANLSGATVFEVDMTGAFLNNANLTGASGLETSDLSGVVWDNTTCPDGMNSNDDGDTCVNNLGT